MVRRQSPISVDPLSSRGINKFHLEGDFHLESDIEAIEYTNVYQSYHEVLQAMSHQIKAI